MKRFTMAVLVSAALSATGCARLQVYEDEAMTKETGFKFYVSKPYVLISMTGPNTLATSVVHLPDLSKPYWVKLNPGLFGNSNLKMDFENGSMKAFGQDVTSNVTGLLDSIGGLRKALAEAGAGSNAQVPPVFTLYELTPDGVVPLKVLPAKK